MLKGIRVYANEKGLLDREQMRQPGAYGKPTFDFVKKYGPNVFRMTWWEVTCPDGSGCTLNPEIHSVTIMENGSITVYPSIVTPSWHGWLECGVWRHVNEVPNQVELARLAKEVGEQNGFASR